MGRVGWSDQFYQIFLLSFMGRVRWLGGFGGFSGYRCVVLCCVIYHLTILGWGGHYAMLGDISFNIVGGGSAKGLDFR